MKWEERIYPFQELRVQQDDNEPKKITGLAAVFNKLSEDLGGFKERIKPGAFKKTLKEADVRSLFNHNPDYVIGRNKSGTLLLSETNEGLQYEALPPDTQWARDLLVSMERGDIDQSSFGFRVISDEWHTESEEEIREIKEVALRDVSPVTFPAYLQTTSEVRSKLGTAGFDVDRLCRILYRDILLDKDEEIVREAIAYLNRLLPSEPRQESHLDDSDDRWQGQGRLAILRRQLDLAEVM